MILNEDKFSLAMTKYIKHCESSNWLSEESYKFYFANWLNQKVNFGMPIESILNNCLLAMKTDYSIGKGPSVIGVQFLIKGAGEKLSEPIKKETIELIKYLKNHDLPDKDFFNQRSVSYPALSGWLATLVPAKFLPVVKSDFQLSFAYLFDSDDIPTEGYDLFVQGNNLMLQTKERLKQASLPQFFASNIKKYITEKFPRQPKLNGYNEVEWNWATQDFYYYMTEMLIKKNQLKKTPKEQTHNLAIYKTFDLNTVGGEFKTASVREIAFTVEDYLEKYQNQLRKGHWAEQIVYQNEVDFLKQTGKTNLADKVKIVSENPDLGYDILSFEIDGTEKQIEVKSIQSTKPKQFYLTVAELRKSGLLKNYYLYCVVDKNPLPPEILRLRNPIFVNNICFQLEPVQYKVSFL